MLVDKDTILDLLDYRDKVREYWNKKGLLQDAEKKVSDGWKGYKITSEELIDLLSYVVERLNLPVKETFYDVDLLNIAEYLEREYHCEMECDVQTCENGVRYHLIFSNNSYIIKHVVCPRWLKQNYLIPALNEIIGNDALNKLAEKMNYDSVEEMSVLELAKIYTYSTGRR